MEYFVALVTAVFATPWAMRVARLMTQEPVAAPTRRMVRR